MSLLIPFGSKKYLLDRVSGAEAAYALHRLGRIYTGPAIRVRRSSDNAETNVFFIGPWVTLNSQVSAGGSFGDWVGSDSAFVTTWYDQSGNANDATQSTAGSQPRIVNAGTLDVDANGRAQMVFDGTDDALLGATFTSVAQPNEILSVAKYNATSGSPDIVDGRSGSARHVLGVRSGNLLIYAGASLAGSAADTSRHLYGALFNGGSSLLRVDGSTDASGDAGSHEVTGVAIGARHDGAAERANANIQAVVLYTRDLAAQRSIAEQEINSMLEIW